MPSRKKERGNGKLRKAERNRKSPKSHEMIRGLKRDGCRIEIRADGSTAISHPCMKPGEDNLNKLGDTSLLNDDEKARVADNYIHNYAQDLRDGKIEGTNVITEKLECRHLGPVLSRKLVNAGLHNDILGFLSQCGNNMFDELRGPLPPVRIWLNTLRLIAYKYHGDHVLAIANGIEPVVVCMTDQRRQLFGSNMSWYGCVDAFVLLVNSLARSRSKEVFMTMVSYKVLIPFLAQACCLSQRKDIATEARLFEVDDIISTVCWGAQKALFNIVTGCGDIRKEGKGDPLDIILDNIARTPLLNNDPNCSDSIIVGMIRMIDRENQGDDNGALKWVHNTLMKAGYVDARVIAELVKLGNTSTVIGILGLSGNDLYKHNQPSDSRYAVAVRHGFLEMLIQSKYDHVKTFHAMKGHIHVKTCHVMKELFAMAMHDRTSRALRQQKAEIFLALDALGKSSTAYKILRPIINDTLELCKPICCNCLKEFDRKRLQYCEACNIECYCSVQCQSESWCAGHKCACKAMVGFGSHGFSEKNTKRFRVLETNLLMAGCRFVRDNFEEILTLLAREYQRMEVVIDFREYPPSITLENRFSDEYLDILKCVFVSSVFYGFADQKEVICCEKFIPSSQVKMLVAKMSHD